jgi:Ca-activated chloride channel family protein
MHLRSSATGPLGAGMGFALLLVAGGPIAQGQADISHWPVVRIEFLALDAQSNPISGLASDELVLKEGGEEQTIEELKVDPGAQSICILIDSSGSMYNRRENIRSAFVRLVRSLPAADEVCIANFSWRLSMDQEFTQDRELDMAAFEHIKESGGTRLRDALMGLSEYMRGAAKNSSRAILLVSDGGDNASMSSEAEMKRRMEMGGGATVHLICVPVDKGHDTGSGDEDKKPGQHIARMLGGLSYFPHSQKDIDAAVDQLVQAMETRYTLTYRTNYTAMEGQEKEMSVAFNKAHKGAKAIIHAPEGYDAPLH